MMRWGRTESMRRPVHAALLAVVLIVTGGPTSALAATPTDGGPITLLPVTINASAGDQFDPHVSGDLASYTDGDTVRYYNFFTGDDLEVPAEVGASDQLSDASNGKVAFSRLDLDTFDQAIMVFDTATATATEIDPQSGSHRAHVAIGSDTVAFIDTGLNLTGELLASQLGGGTNRVTNDTRYDQEPSAAPLGDLIVYESCQSSPGNCDIRQAGWNSSSWVVTSLTNNSEPEANPDTDGVVVVYDAARSGEKDIIWQHVGGSAEQTLGLPGEQRNPSVSGGVMAFESIAVGDSAADLYVYQISSNHLFRITSTPDDETLNDISVLGDGRVRVVWSSGPSGSRNVYSATFELPPVGPTYTFGGFLQPVDARPTLNSLKAGAAVPVKFSLGGNHGLDIFAAGYPKSQVIACESTANVDAVEQTVNAGGSSLTYDATTDTYTFIWKTDKTWAGTCRQLVLGFADGTLQRANFKLK
jgi:hypothetical protein